MVPTALPTRTPRDNGSKVTRAPRRLSIIKTTGGSDTWTQVDFTTLAIYFNNDRFVFNLDAFDADSVTAGDFDCGVFPRSESLIIDNGDPVRVDPVRNERNRLNSPGG